MINNYTCNFRIIPENPPEEVQPSLPVLQPGDHLMMPHRLSANTTFLDEHYNPDMTNRKNFMNTITDKSKNILNFFGGDTTPETGAIADETEKKKAERYEASNKNLFFSESEINPQKPNLGRAPLPQISEDENALCINDISINTVSGAESDPKLWIGKDYANFIVKDFTNLELPFVGENFKY